MIANKSNAKDKMLNIVSQFPNDGLLKPVTKMRSVAAMPTLALIG